MKKRILFLVVAYLCVCPTHAQDINHVFKRNSMPDVLKYCQEHTRRYTINFIYNELEDYTVTSHVRAKNIPDAIRQAIGFYPISMTVDDSLITVESIPKDRQKLIGRLVDEAGQPMCYANVQLFTVNDSSFIAGGVTNENGDFVVPCSTDRVIAKFSYVGYKTVYLVTPPKRIGYIKLYPDVHTIKGVTVKGSRPQYKMQNGGVSVDVEHSLLSKMGTSLDVLGELPRVSVSGDNISIFAKGKPEIYINNKLVRDNGDLTNLKSADIKSVDVITSPGAEYNAAVKSVIRIHTKAPQGDGFSVRNTSNVRYNTQWGGYEQLDLKYRTRGFEVFGKSFLSSLFAGERNPVSSSLYLPDYTLTMKENADDVFRQSVFQSTLGFTYDINQESSFGATYTLSKTLYGKGHTVDYVSEIWKDDQLQGRIANNEDMEIWAGPMHELNAYYLGKVAGIGIDFNGTYIWRKNGRNDHIIEESETLGSRVVNTCNTTHNRMVAGKLILSHKLGGGKIRIGEEISHTNTHSIYDNPENYVDSSRIDIRESNDATFADYSVSRGDWSLNAGLRYEHVKTEYYAFGVRQEEPSRTYHDWFPNFSIAWNHSPWSLQLSMSRKISRPSYVSLRSNVQYIGRYSREAGNPYLRPTFAHNIELTAIYKWLYLTIGYDYDKDCIAYYSYLSDKEPVSILQNRNFNHMQDVYASIVASPKFGWYQPTLEIDLGKNFFNAGKYGSLKAGNDPSCSIRLNSKFVISKQGFITLNLKYNSESSQDFVKTRADGTVDIAYVQSFCHNKFQLNLYANDLFKTRKSSWVQYGNKTAFSKDCYEYTRSIGMTLTYNFNVSKSRYKGTGAGNEEKNRL
ncbi:outer membrane beta-barrel family protein [Prevotella sp. KH2C16]|uniref:outer membrane beta-barrel family protein n=1 Tax=Prevotella sp. KH2C16 TaxID=1855325 RepID=UPI0008EE3CF7|nr:outer membrane beta-barrel family protein [Prevotella sp. KH2C16]SFG64649.1 Outer membrane receptor proteins, mostly Fe transport [Prevotella sp. KH2C16]